MFYENLAYLAPAWALMSLQTVPPRPSSSEQLAPAFAPRGCTIHP